LVKGLYYIFLVKALELILLSNEEGLIIEIELLLT